VLEERIEIKGSSTGKVTTRTGRITLTARRDAQSLEKQRNCRSKIVSTERTTVFARTSLVQAVNSISAAHHNRYPVNKYTLFVRVKAFVSK
jgi:hypothetical protein